MTIDLDHLEALAKAATPGKWVVQSSNSWRRIGTTEDGNVLCPITQRDGHPDLDGENREADLDLVVAAVNALPTLCAEVRRVRADIDSANTARKRAEDLAEEHRRDCEALSRGIEGLRAKVAKSQRGGSDNG